jgi:branched-chain amino acid transport system permease protein
MIDSTLLLNVLVNGLLIGSIYCLMAIGIAFVYSVMRIINWSMAGYYVMGGYIQYLLVVQILGAQYWFLAIPITMFLVFLIGLIYNRVVLSGLYERGIKRKFEYATVLTIFTLYVIENSAIFLAGERIFKPPEFFGRIDFGLFFISGSKVLGSFGAILVLFALSLFLQKTWYGLALRASSQERIGCLSAGINLKMLDGLAFGLGCALAAAAGAYLAPTYLVFPTAGTVTTTKGFNIIIIGGMGSLKGAIVGGLLLGLVETFCSVYFIPAYRDIYGFALLVLILIFKPAGLFGERKRAESIGSLD